LAGLAAFKALGGRFWAIAPSSYTAPGSFARQSIPATENYATQKELQQLDSFFKQNGCHTCGNKAGGFHGDHMPPKAIGQRQRHAVYRFYGQCEPCSNHQGGILSKATASLNQRWPKWKQVAFLQSAGGGAAAYNHGAQPRVNHLAGGIYGGIATLAAPKRDIDQNLSNSFASLEVKLSSVFSKFRGLFNCS